MALWLLTVSRMCSTVTGIYGSVPAVCWLPFWRSTSRSAKARVRPLSAMARASLCRPEWKQHQESVEKHSKVKAVYITVVLTLTDVQSGGWVVWKCRVKIQDRRRRQLIYLGWPGRAAEPGSSLFAGQRVRVCSRCCAASRDGWSRITRTLCTTGKHRRQTDFTLTLHTWGAEHTAVVWKINF